MKKNFLQDVIPPNHKRSIRDIPLPSHRGKISGAKVGHDESPKPRVRSVRKEETFVAPTFIQSELPEENAFENKEQIFDPEQLQTGDYSDQNTNTDRIDPASTPPYKAKRSASSPFKKIFVSVLIGAVLFAGIVLSRTQAKVVIYPKQGTYEIDNTIPTDTASVAVKTQITKSLSVSLEATSEQQVERQATGRIKIINMHDEADQELVKNTRFKTPEGLIYQIRESVVIPGFTNENGKVIPGTLEVDVYASSAGEEYNIGKTKFVIPGFEGREQFDKITAESVTEMTGGYIGIKKVVSEDAEEDAEAQLRDQLTAQFTADSIESESNIILPDPETITYGELKDEVNGNMVTLSLTATVEAYSFKKAELFNYVGQNTIVGATTSDMFTMDPKNLQFTIEDSAIIVRGSTAITWVTDIEILKRDIAGKKRSEIATVVNSYESFEKADIVLKPFWKTKFPADSSKILVEVAQ